MIKKLRKVWSLPSRMPAFFSTRFNDEFDDRPPCPQKIRKTQFVWQFSNDQLGDCSALFGCQFSIARFAAATLINQRGFAEFTILFHPHAKRLLANTEKLCNPALLFSLQHRGYCSTPQQGQFRLGQISVILVLHILLYRPPIIFRQIAVGVISRAAFETDLHTQGRWQDAAAGHRGAGR